ncbi:Monothiol glutaredoxin-S5 [Dichanthelium oligosanthes]|uniref:Monothiol glutaredoxin-S5 n=1 Tax=Dichanthelium oligosanthes TaxID=888268 RepID=A0A1E5VIN5_9POAL|nr:Monothiol glutaredoxin-S5 [Dichanthelium oligosanthes]
MTPSPTLADLTALYISCPPLPIIRRHKSHPATEPKKKKSNSCKRQPRRMHQAIPYSASRPWPPRPRPAPTAAVVDAVAASAAAEERQLAAAQQQPAAAAAAREEVRRTVAESPVLVVGRRGCCLSHVVKRLLQGLGVNPAVHEVAGEAELAGVVDGDVALPAVFVGGRLLGGLDRLMAVHISGELVPILKEAGALWL